MANTDTSSTQAATASGPEVRKWAKESGQFPDLKDRGRISGDVRAAYEAAHQA